MAAKNGSNSGRSSGLPADVGVDLDAERTELLDGALGSRARRRPARPAEPARRIPGKWSGCLAHSSAKPSLTMRAYSSTCSGFAVITSSGGIGIGKDLRVVREGCRHLQAHVDIVDRRDFRARACRCRDGRPRSEPRRRTSSGMKCVYASSRMEDPPCDARGASAIIDRRLIIDRPPMACKHSAPLADVSIAHRGFRARTRQDQDRERQQPHRSRCRPRPISAVSPTAASSTCSPTRAPTSRPIIEALTRNTGSGRKFPRVVTVPHENVAMAMAHGYYRIVRQAGRRDGARDGRHRQLRSTG